VAVSLESCEAALKPVLGKIFDLYLVTLLEKNLSFFVISGLLQPADIGKVKRRGAELCAELGPQVSVLVFFHCDSDLDISLGNPYLLCTKVGISSRLIN